MAPLGQIQPANFGKLMKWLLQAQEIEKPIIGALRFRYQVM